MALENICHTTHPDAKERQERGQRFNYCTIKIFGMVALFSSALAFLDFLGAAHILGER